MTKITAHSSFIAKAGALFLVLVVGAYLNPSKSEEISPESVIDMAEEKYNEIDANSLIRTVSYRNNTEPILAIRKK
ncbi:MAG TPA: hypothetical protein DCE41_21835 [Cytophagales bacterium]|nr:hypothetical protein [Cytophagales bacterium]HAA23273.1 hypothetical protein [Cytophagales bacterium]HAP61843.1 hypothetical protein [Cytophagales bacterium]